MRLTNINLHKINYYFILSESEEESLKRSIELGIKRQLSEDEQKEYKELKEVLKVAVAREDKIFNRIDTMRANAKEGKRKEWIKPQFLNSAFSRSITEFYSDGLEDITINKILKFLRIFYEVERKQFTEKQKRSYKYKVGAKNRALTLRQLFKYLFEFLRIKY